MLDKLLGGLSRAEFLATYWQKRPLLVRGAWPDFVDPLAPDELAGLAMEPGVRARLVLEKGGKRPWQLEHGPFSERRLRRLPRSHWTLLVSDVETWVESAGTILDRFTFIPNWRCDDLMISLAPPAGSVGPHIDSYDVFLLQGRGRRRWGIQGVDSKVDERWRPGVDLRILRSFKAEQEWVLEPGDMLYLPPGIAHHGVALEECLTYSIGFRAPRRIDLLGSLYNLPSELLGDATGLYTDPDLELQANPGEISAASLARVAAIVRGPLEDPATLGRWFAALMTQPPPPAPGAVLEVPPRRRRPSAARLGAMLAPGQVLVRSETPRLAYLPPVGRQFYLYIGGDERQLDVALLPLVQAICAKRAIATDELLRRLPAAAARPAALALVGDLVQVGVLYLQTN